MGKRTLIFLGVIVVIGILFYSAFIGKYNTMVEMDETVSAQWANVENQYQRRADLVPNLVNTVKGYAAHEKNTLEAVVQARAKATSVNINPGDLNSASIEKFQAAQNGLSSALSKLLVVVERYPDLKANRNFLELQAQLEGTENRIAVERSRFNEGVRQYNTYIRQFPANFVAGMFGFEKRTLFESKEGSDVVPEVDFSS